jgi:putative aldouronate transport system permease protein
MFKKTFGDRTLDLFIYTFLLLAAAVTLIPFANVFSKSISAEYAVVSGKVGIFPIGFQLDTMKYVVTSHEFLHAFAISVGVTVLGTILSTLLTAVTAYPLSKRYLPGISFIMLLFVFTMLFNGGIIPNYLLIRNLGMLNHLSALILPVLISVFNMLVIKSYYEGLPDALEDSAKMDGARTFTILFRIILPLSMPVLATIGLFYAVYYWNDFFNPVLYLSDPSLKPLQLYLRDVIIDSDASTIGNSANDLMNVTAEGVRSAAVIASTLPILFVYPFLQKYFIKGVLIGSVKG